MSKEEGIPINSVIEYIKQIEDFKAQKGVLNPTFNPIKIFRGVLNERYDYTPSINREYSKINSNRAAQFENTMIRKAKLAMPELFSNNTYPINALTKLQHYGLPTRLMDFTYNALVALYFAAQDKTENYNKVNGKVLVIIEPEEYIYDCYSPIINAIAEMSTTSKFSEYDFDTFVEQLNTQGYWNFPNKGNTKPIDIKKRIDHPLLFETEANSERIKRQKGLFMIFPNNFTLKDLTFLDDKGNEFVVSKLFLTGRIKEWVPPKGRFMELIIPAHKKYSIRKSLELLGVTKSYLFPEPEHICANIFDNVLDTINENGMPSV